jgi:hypothetical protein
MTCGPAAMGQDAEAFKFFLLVRFSRMQKTSERMRLISLDAILSETLKRLCASDSVSKRFAQI